WGYKFWMGTTRLGYVEWFDPYQGSSTTIQDKYKQFGLGAKLKSRGHKGTDTIRENRLGKDCKIMVSNTLKKKERGSFDYCTAEENEIVVCKWNDNNVKEKKRVLVDQPNIIKKYNENMGGVDRTDENISHYRVSIRGNKWYFPIRSQILDMAEQNAWQLYRIGGGKIYHLQFRRSIAVGILESYKKSTKTGPSKPSENLHMHSRFDGMNHLIMYKEKPNALCYVP
ncbi:hypothetical protein ILUMI_16772, partial [Ignelater luminosus]